MLEEGAACQAGAGAGRNCCRPGAAETFARWGTFAWGWGAGGEPGGRALRKALRSALQPDVPKASLRRRDQGWGAVKLGEQTTAN